MMAKVQETKPKVLVVDDSSVINRLVTGMLRMFENLETTHAKSGEIALEKFKTDRFDLIIVDVNLPLMDGIQVTKKIRAAKNKRSDVPIIGISGNAKNRPEADFFEAGMNEFLPKPLDYDKLIELVKKYIPEED